MKIGKHKIKEENKPHIGEKRKWKIDPWQHQAKFLDEYGIPSYNLIKSMVERIQDARVKALVSIMYLTGGRIGEVLHIKRINVSLPIINGKEYLKVHMINEKQQNTHNRTKDILCASVERDTELIQAFLIYVNSGIITFADERIFNITPQRVHVLLKKHAKLYVETNESYMTPHLFRHIRATHLSEQQDYNLFELMKFLGWITLDMATRYVKPNQNVMAKKLDKESNE